jgi:nicotinamide riboside kinase
MRNLIARFVVCAVACDIAPVRLVIPGFIMVWIVAMLAFTGRLSAEDKEQSKVVKWIEAAEESGRLQVDFYDPRKPPKSFPGWTDFEFTLEYQFNHQTRWKPTKGNTFAVTIVPTFTRVEPLVSHIIKLPRTTDDSLWHESVLGSHELDHVAIGSHPRLIMLSTHLLKTMGKLNRNADRVADVTRKWADESITEEVNDRRRAVQMLITTNNDRLDDLTRHGGRAIREREAFFNRLYLKENLDESKFKYIGETLKLLETEEYLSAKSIFEN